MSLLSNYVAAVKRHLPGRMREDVGEELKSSLADSLDALEEATGRPLSDDEIAEILKRRGHPLLVASAYRGDRALVSSQSFPIYARALQTGFAIIVGVALASVMFGNDSESPQPRDLLHLFYRIYWPTLSMFTWVTAMFYFADSWMERTHFLQRWNPKNLRKAEEFSPEISVRNPVLEIVVLVLLFSFIKHAAHLPGRLLKLSTPIEVAIGPTWHGWMQQIVSGLAATIVGIAVLSLIYGVRHRSTLWLGMAANGLLGVCLAVFIFDPRGIVIDLAGAVASPSELASIIFTTKVLLGSIAAMCFFHAAQHMKWLRSQRPFDASYRSSGSKAS